MTAIHDQRAQERAAAGAERQQLEEKVTTLEGLLQKARQQASEPRRQARVSGKKQRHWASVR
jgi:F0F1-type ATP synthase membrane subunit b/b'